MVNDTSQPTNDNDEASLLEALPLCGLLRGLSRLALAAGELPVAGVDRSFRTSPDQVPIIPADQADGRVRWRARTCADS